MLKYILFISLSVPIIFYAWKKVNTVKPVEQVQQTTLEETKKETVEETKKEIVEKTFKNEDLHTAFVKILSIEKNKKIKYTIDDLILAYRENREVLMTLEEIRLIIKKLEKEISLEEKNYAISGAQGAEVDSLEARIADRKEELENFKFMEYQYTGVKIEK